MPGRNWESGMIGSPASAVPGAMPARRAAPRAAARWRTRIGGATLAPGSWCDFVMPTTDLVQAWLDARSLLALCRVVPAPPEALNHHADARSLSYHRTHLRTALSETPYLRPTADQLVASISASSC